MTKTLLIITTLIFSKLGFSQTFTDGNFTYQVLTPTTVSLTDYNVAGGTDVIIPPIVTYSTVTYDVTFIGYQAFMSKNITSVDIPNSVTDIVNGAFLFNSLTSVTIPNSVTNIWPAAFGSNSLTSVSIGNNVTTIGDNAFNGNQLTSFTFPSGLTSIGKQVFANNNFTNVTIPNSITFIGEGAFLGNPLVTVTSENLLAPDITTANDLSDSFADDRSNIDLIIPAGTMSLYVTDASAEWTGFKSVTEESASSSINESYVNRNITIFPNPAVNQLTIDSEDKIDRIIITDALGNSVKTNFSIDNSLNISHLTTGVYIIQIETNKGTATKRFVKK